MTPKKQSSNNELAADIKELKTMIVPLMADVKMLKEKELTRDIATNAVEEYKRQEKSELRSQAQSRQTKARTDLLVKLAILITALTTLALTYYKR
jgi:hypothetical protein